MKQGVEPKVTVMDVSPETEKVSPVAEEVSQPDAEPSFPDVRRILQIPVISEISQT